MTATKRPARKTAPPAALSVPRVRAIRSDDNMEPMQPHTPIQARPRRNRKPKFVF